MRLGVTPVPIPNTMVKTQTAEGTALETVWESRWPPNLKEKDRGRSAAEVKINTGKDEQQLINANPISRAVLLKSWVYQWSEFKKDFEFWWLINNQSKLRMRSSKAYGFIAHGTACQCIKNKYCLGKQAFHTASFLLRSHSSVPWKLHTEKNQWYKILYILYKTSEVMLTTLTIIQSEENRLKINWPIANTCNAIHV